MKTLKEYLATKRNRRIIGMTFDGLAVIYRFMNDEEKGLLESHKTSIEFDGDMRDCYPIKCKYCLSWNEVRMIVKRYA